MLRMAPKPNSRWTIASEFGARLGWAPTGVFQGLESEYGRQHAPGSLDGPKVPQPHESLEGGGCGEPGSNSAAADLAESIVSRQSVLPEQLPLHPLKLEPPVPEALRETPVPSL